MTGFSDYVGERVVGFGIRTFRNGNELLSSVSMVNPIVVLVKMIMEGIENV